MSKVTVTTGTEGPRHDPYSVTTYTVDRPNGTRAVLHEGMSTSATIRWPDEWVERVHTETRAVARFERAIGISLPALHRALVERTERRYRLHKCGNDCFSYVRGHPGETFVICDKCGDVIDSSFDKSAVE